MKLAFPNAATAAALAAAVLSVASMSSAFAQEAPPPHPPMGPGFAVVNDLEQLRRLYSMTGHPEQIVAVYHDVLNKTQDPFLRHYVYDSLAREQLKPTNPDQAIATLRTSLAEDLVASNRMPKDGGPGHPHGPAPEAGAHGTPPAPPPGTPE
ncbi:hypothetical protein [Paraburkholderia sp.]|uniref:hypothetical protein n=1 Tax=Paraburkholderia sp. TaxID=1926495 RepID=UPI00239A78D6|nr:hypothetical protein [Paraburkholderia sp.]MDE1180125.1 hypothetical protein [Paraburkholderia sp.]